ncbi:hypothetical protein A5867_001825 [Enterococcus sp. 6D12_DIV0197]|uniref:YopX family protein n=1 Tax=Enterococcus TaxID=1350 RepID=UPI000B3EC28D|nr:MULTISPECIES: YopX family protein [Enterococcus]MCX4167822.1 YopX family protein [Enterococcus casseliflavus]MEB6179489.1 YopX family protein [Enterococcus casseliflavus]OUZ24139.1 hypothetical protein A5867_001825 [Enterococcus sp. 6D12_DIV0197]DAL90199.1 MAG TPA: YopX protein [Caudoviricetes sp.]
MVPKFRAWDGQDMVMRDVEQLRFAHNSNNHVVYITIDAEEWATGPALILMQSTGLKDKNGVEIFEGDVLTSNVQPCKMVNPIKDGYGVVCFENGMFKLGAISLVTFISKMEVIGNIYENPELLEQANEK